MEPSPKLTISLVTKQASTDMIEIALTSNLNSNNRNNTKSTNSWKLKNTLCNGHWVRNEIKKEIKDFLELKKNEIKNISKLTGHSESSVKSQVYSSKCFHKEIGVFSYYDLKVHLKALEKRNKHI
jgi:ribosomal protein S24E